MAMNFIGVPAADACEMAGIDFAVGDQLQRPLAVLVPVQDASTVVPVLLDPAAALVMAPQHRMQVKAHPPAAAGHEGMLAAGTAHATQQFPGPRQLLAAQPVGQRHVFLGRDDLSVGHVLERLGIARQLRNRHQQVGMPERQLARHEGERKLQREVRVHRPKAKGRVEIDGQRAGQQRRRPDARVEADQRRPADLLHQRLLDQAPGWVDVPAQPQLVVAGRYLRPMPGLAQHIVDRIGRAVEGLPVPDARRRGVVLRLLAWEFERLDHDVAL
mmetsp:Transcript_39165/g.91900  ORF Transcript_39165/g.91900 Transcript_39165/m.91900 type:complete len:272 (+) Transcript_39165:1733-2548(+)